ncbi:MAG TPA: MerR family transcriptional regulator [Mycobacteriales bacterium]|nr:MerR family transcriptional regulator [Mycobacteriales bacterium]
MSHSVGQVAGLAGVTVRTLHHYDEIGLLSPDGRTSSGYRRYTEADLERLQQILFYRELGFALEEIAAILDDPGADAAVHLRRQHGMLTRRVERLQAMVAAVEHAMEAQQMGISLTPEERFEVFGDVNPEEYAEEAEQRWGGTDAYEQSRRRTATYTKDDWKRIMAAGADLNRRLARAMSDGVPPDGDRALDLAEEHRLSIDQTYYDCSHQMHRGLADMYLADPRFTAYYEKVAPGLAQWLHDAIHANADRADASTL